MLVYMSAAMRYAFDHSISSLGMSVTQLTWRNLQMRMGKGKGSFDHWATRMAVSQVLFEIKGRIHEQIVRDAFRLAGNKLPGEPLFNASCLALRLTAET